jgi:hypothetical protein
MSAFKLPDMWWRCECLVQNIHDAEWTEQVEVLASTKDEAEAAAEKVLAARGLDMYVCNPRPLPEKRVVANTDHPPRPVYTPPPYPAWGAQRGGPPPAKPKEPEWDSVYFTKYRDTCVVTYSKEDRT